MNWRNFVSIAAVVFGAAAAGGAHAQATATWVSGVGDDVNPCSRTAPCKTYAGAISKTAPGGIIRTLDPGGFGAVTITKSMTIEGIPGMSNILHTSVNGVIVNAQPTDLVVLRNLVLDGTNATPNTANVHILKAGLVVIDNVQMQRGATGVSIDVNAGAVKVEMRDSTVTGAAIGVHNASAFASVMVQGGVLRGNGTGVVVDGGDVALVGVAVDHNTLGFSLTNGALWTDGNNTFYGNGDDGVKSGHIRRVKTQ